MDVPAEALWNEPTWWVGLCLTAKEAMGWATPDCNGRQDDGSFWGQSSAEDWYGGGAGNPLPDVRDACTRALMLEEVRRRTGDATAYLAPRAFLGDGDDHAVPGWGLYARGDCIGVGSSEAEALLMALTNARSSGVVQRSGPRRRAAEMIEDLRKLPPDALVFCWDTATGTGSDVYGVLPLGEVEDLTREAVMGAHYDDTTPVGIVLH
jgi:hypothetical protein